MTALAMLLILPALAGVQPSVVPEGMPGPAPATAIPMALQGALPPGPMALAWTGGRVLASDQRGTLLVLDPATGEVRATAPPQTSKTTSRSKKSKKPPPPPPALQASALGPSGQVAAMVADTVWVYDPATGKPRWKAPAAGATALRWSVDGAALVGSGHNTITVWDNSTGLRLEAPDTRSTRFAYAARQQRLLVATDRGLDLYDTAGARHLSGETDLRVLAMSADGRRAAAAGKKLWIWDVEGHRQIAEIDDPKVELLAFSADGTRLALGESGAVPVTVLDASTGARLGGVRASGPVRGLLFSPDNAEIWWMSQSALYHAPAVYEDWTATLPGAGRWSALATTRDRVAVGTESGLVALWSAEGNLLWSAQGTGATRDLRLSDDGQLLAGRFQTDLFWSIPSGEAQGCTPEVPPCARLGAPNSPGLGTLPPALATAMLQGAWVSPFAEGAVELCGEQLRLWGADGALSAALWAGSAGTWGRWSAGRYFWGAMAPVFSRREGGVVSEVKPPPAEAKLRAEMPAVALIEGGPPAELQVLVKNEGPGPAYGLRAAWAGDSAVAAEGDAEIARLDPGASLPVRVRLRPLGAGSASPALTVSGLYGDPAVLTLPIAVAPWPLSLGKVKVKGQKVKIQLTRSGSQAVGPVRIWLAASGPGGGQSLSTGEMGRLAIWKSGEGSKDALVFDEITLREPSTELEWRFSDRGARDLRLVLQLPGGTPREIPLVSGK